MKHIIQVIFALLFLILLNSCESKSNYDLFELINVLNTQYDYNIIYEDFEITFDKCYQYRTKLKQNIIVVFYCDEKNEIIQCAITTTDKSDNDYISLCQNINFILTAANTEVKNNSQTQNGWVTQKIDNAIGQTVMITKANNAINYAEKPTIKEKIDESIITRPTKGY